MALTIKYETAEAKVTPWSPDYKSYNDPERNAFFKVPPEIAQRA